MARKTPLADLPAQTDARAPFAAATFLRAAKPVLALLTADLLTRADASEAVRAALHHHHQAEVDASRTADDYAVWRRRVVVQIATAWLLSCVFVRVLEDRGLVSARIAGPGAHDSETEFFRLFPSLGEREYLLNATFRELTLLPAAAALFDVKHNLVWRLGPSAEACKALLQLLRAPHIDTPAFRFGQPDTRFLGDLYQDLDEGVRERYALLQTPDFIESFILDRTLEPAIAEYGVDHADMIDPTCGSGHFLLGAFNRFVTHLRNTKPGLHDREIATEALNRVHGVDINPYAVSIARFRLTLQFLEFCGYKSLYGVPVPPLNVIVADSLYYGFAGGQGDLGERPDQLLEQKFSWYGNNFTLEESDESQRILVKKTYAAVVGNPPYITVKDPVLREFYRERYEAAAGKYALSAPFMERFFQLARTGGGYVGQITSNSFTKREFGAALIEKVLPRYDLELIINTAGVFIPGHGTPTILVFGRNRRPSSEHVHAVLAKNGEPSVPSTPAEGKVWRSICDNWRKVGFEDDYESVELLSRSALCTRPWQLDGGGARELKNTIEIQAQSTLTDIVSAIGIGAVMGEDEIFIGPHSWLRRIAMAPHHVRSLCEGEDIRDWKASLSSAAIFPYDAQLNPELPDESYLAKSHLWSFRTNLINRQQFGKNTLEAGLEWYEYRGFYRAKIHSRTSLAFASISTHNHFTLNHELNVFKQSAPIVKFQNNHSHNDHLALLSYLNSSTARFCIKQVTYPKGTSNGDVSLSKSLAENNRYDFSATAVGSIPAPVTESILSLFPFAERIEHLQVQRDALTPRAILLTALSSSEDLTDTTLRAEREDAALHARMVAVQEDLDWAVYQFFKLAPPETAARWTPNLELTPAQRPFNHPYPPPHLGPADRALYLARVAAITDSKQLRLIENPINKRPWKGSRGIFGHKVTTFAERVADAAVERIADMIEDILRARCSDNSTPTVVTARELERELSAHPHYQRLRDFLVTGDPRLDPLRDQLARESVPFLAGYRYTPAGLDRHARWRHVWDLQRIADVSEAKLPALRDALAAATTAAREATAALATIRSKLGAPAPAPQADPAPARRSRGARKPALVPDIPDAPAPAPTSLFTAKKPPELLAAEAREAAALAALSEARQELEWADTHHRKTRKLIPVPSKYDPGDFRDANYFRLRGKLDVPRERFISYPHTASDLDGQPVYGWAGWNHLQRSLALLQLYYHRKLEERWSADRLVPLLAGLEELLPWVRQWHADECHPGTGERYADALETHIQAGCGDLGVTRPQLLAWTPTDTRARRTSLTNRTKTGPADQTKPRTKKPDPADEAEPRTKKTDPADEAEPRTKKTDPADAAEPRTKKSDPADRPASTNSLKPARGRPRRAGTR